MADFDPDKYLAEKESSFDPDKYLAEKEASTPVAAATPTLLDQAKSVGESVLPVVGKVVDYPFGFGRTAVGAATGQATLEDLKNTLKGNAPSLDEYMGRAGVPEMGHPLESLPSTEPGKPGPIPLKLINTLRQKAGYNPTGRQMLSSAGDLANIEATSAGLGKVISSGAKSAGGAAGAAGSKVLSTVTGVPEETIQTYAANPDAVNNAKPFEDLHSEMQGLQEQRGHDLEAAKENLSSAKEQAASAKGEAQLAHRDVVSDSDKAVNDLKSKIDQDIMNTKLQHQQDVSEIARKAQEEAHQSNDAFKAKLMEHTESVPHPRQLLDKELPNAVDALKKRAVGFEAAATEEAGKLTLPAAPVIEHLDNLIEEYKYGPNRDVAKDEGAISELNSIKDKIEKLSANSDKAVSPFTEVDTGMQDSAGNPIMKKVQNTVDASQSNLRGEDLRNLMKSINRSTHWQNTSGGFMPKPSMAANDVRMFLQNNLKQASDAAGASYTPLIEKSANAFDILEDANKYFGNEGKAHGALSNMHTEAGSHKLGVLKSLGDELGQDYVTPIKQYGEHLDKMASPEFRTALRLSLPETATAAEASQQADYMKNPLVKEKLFNETRQMHPLAPDLAEAQKQADYMSDSGVRASNVQDQIQPAQDQVSIAQSQVENAKQAQEPLKGSMEQLLKKAMQAKSIENEQRLGKISSQLGEGRDLAEEARLSGVKQQFEGGVDRSRGSKRTLAGGLLGGKIGAALGYATDLYGGPIAKAFVDAGIKVNPAKLGKYGPILAEAYKTSGQNGLAARHFVLSQRDPAYQKLMSEEDLSNKPQ